MPGYLDHYGEGYEQRAKRRKLIAAIILIVVIGGGVLYFTLRHHRQNAKVTQFFTLLQKQDYAGAYRFWGCTDAKPCPDYKLSQFMEDWGPNSANAPIAGFHIVKSQSCGSGVIVTTDLGQNRVARFWVEGSEMTIGFAPWSVCPAR